MKFKSIVFSLLLTVSLVPKAQAMCQTPESPDCRGTDLGMKLDDISINLISSTSGGKIKTYRIYTTYQYGEVGWDMTSFNGETCSVQVSSCAVDGGGSEPEQGY